MKNLVILLLALSCSAAISSPVIKTGQFVTGYDREMDVVLTKNIQVWLNKAGVSEMRIEGEDILTATFENGKISAYVSNPKKYLYYSLELNPAKAPYGNTNLIISHRQGATTSYCREGTTSLLTGYVADGTSANFCVTLK